MVRRVMCLKGSRRGSGESSCHQALNEEEESSRGGISVDRSDADVLLFRMTGPLQTATHTRRLSEADWLLLETLDTRCIRPLHTGRFLTMHKRRRKRLTTRSLQQDPGLLDDVHHGLVQCLLNRVWQWPFNAFSLDAVTGGRSLPVLCVHLFHWYGLLDHFNLDVVRVWKLFTLIEEGYHGTNPYHNSIHATDVTQAMHCFLQEDKIREHLTPLEIMSSLVAAVTHDLDHPGVNQPFLIATSNHLAALYENTSVLENHHWRSAMGCLIESDMAEQLGSCRAQLSSQISSLILATDITRQQEFLTRFKRYMDQGLLDMQDAEHRHFILQIALKCADISNPCRPWEISKKWSQKVCEEFFRQGDYERQLHLPVTSLCDRQSTSVSKIQVGFFRFVVAPLFEEWHRFLNTDLSNQMMQHLKDNKERWDTMVQQEQAEETRTEISDAELIEEGNMSTDDEGECDDLLIPVSPCKQRRPSLPLDDTDAGQRVGRRHSVPLSLSRPPSISRTIIRRESLPVGEYRTQRRYPSGPISEEVDVQLVQSSLSLGSSCSSSGLHLSTCENQENRPVSAESLLPEPSIASITTSLEASRLGSVLHGVTKNPLTRQQTFPPLAPSYVRHRYMSSAGADISEAISSSSSDSFILTKPSSSDQAESSSKPTKGTLFAVRDSTNRLPSAVESCIGNGSGKREQSDSLCRDKGTKMAKLSECATSNQQRWEKENMDPRYDLDLDASNKLLRRTLQGLARRRGSAPVGLTSRDDMTTPLAQRASSDRLKRRGSVPIDVTRQRVKDKSSECLEKLEPSSALWTENSNFPIPWHRRRSIPFDSNVDPCRSEHRILSDTNGGKSRSRRKRELHRRKSGGPEMFSHTTLDAAPSWQRWMRRTTEPLLARRRGSLPLTLAGTSQRMPDF